MSFVDFVLALILAASASQNCIASGIRKEPRPLLAPKSEEESFITLRSAMYANINFQLFAGNSVKWHQIRVANEQMARGRDGRGNILKKIGKNHASWDADTVRTKLQESLEVYPQDPDTMATRQVIEESSDEQLLQFALQCWQKIERTSRTHEFGDGELLVEFSNPFEQVHLPTERGREDSHSYGDYVVVAMNTALQMPEMYVSIWKDERSLRPLGGPNNIQKHFFISRDWRFQIRRWLTGGRGTHNLAMGLHCAAKRATNAQRIVTSPMEEMKKIMRRNGFIHTADATEEDKQEIQESGFSIEEWISTAETKCSHFWEIFS